MALALMGAGCSRVAMSDVTGSIGASQPMPRDEASLRAYSEEWGRRYDANRKDKTAAINYANSLRALTQNAQAVAVLQGLAITYPKDQEVLGNYGKALSEAGQLKQAAEVLQNAHTPERPNWQILSAQGAVADKLGDHFEAQRYYQAALKIRPNDPGVLSNLGLSYALSKNLSQAEEVLRLAAAQPAADMRVRQNLALVLALQGKFSDAEEWSRRDLPPMQASANVASIRQMIAQSNTWRDIQRVDRQPAAKKTGKADRKATQPNEPTNG
jgi:Flp pilus assembly protein TadD